MIWLNVWLPVLVLIVAPVLASKDWHQPIEDDEYELLINWLKDENQLSMAARTRKDKNSIRKFYRWLKSGKDLRVGPSGKVVYIDGRRLLRKEVEEAIKVIDKTTKFSGARKAVNRLNERVVRGRKDILVGDV